MVRLLELLTLDVFIDGKFAVGRNLFAFISYDPEILFRIVQCRCDNRLDIIFEPGEILLKVDCFTIGKFKPILDNVGSQRLAQFVQVP